MLTKREETSPRSRLLRALEGEPVDRPPVICPGGMMTLATAEAMAASRYFWPQAHLEAQAMAGLARTTQEMTGIECLSAPFCMTVEAEALGCAVDLGDAEVWPHVSREAIAEAAQISDLPAFDPKLQGRAPTVLEALKILEKEAGERPVIGAVVGPVSLAATVLEARRFLRLLHRDVAAAQRLVDLAERAALRFALAQWAAGADCVMIAEPTATGEVLGGRHFARLAKPALARMLGALRRAGVPVILHICGDLRRIAPELRRLAQTVGGRLPLSVDAMVGGAFLAAEIPEAIRIGNINTHLLARGRAAAIAEAARRASQEFEIVSPACGLSVTTPNKNLRMLVETIQRQ